MLKNRAQTEVIVTVILILIGITAVSILSAFLINFVRNNLSGTECLEAQGQISLNMGNTYLKTDSGDSWLYFSIARTSKEFNLSGFSVIYGNQYSTKSLQIEGSGNSNLYIINMTGGRTKTMRLPSAGETQVYALNISSLGIDNVNTISIAPIMNKGKKCDIADEKSVSQRS